MAYGALAALDDRPRPGKEPTITPEAKAWLVSLACDKAKEHGYPHELDYATIKLTCRPNLLNSRPQRIGFYSKLEIHACIQWLTDFKLGARVSKIHDRISITHALVFIIFSGCATLDRSARMPKGEQRVFLQPIAVREDGQRNSLWER